MQNQQVPGALSSTSVPGAGRLDTTLNPSSIVPSPTQRRADLLPSRGWPRRTFPMMHGRIRAVADRAGSGGSGPEDARLWRARAGPGAGRVGRRVEGPHRAESLMQIFHPSANTLSRLTVFGSVALVLGPVAVTYALLKSPYQTKVGVIPPQPVPFTHEHHVRGLGIDCRYCHTSVEESSFAGMPPTHTCMTCHSQIWTDSPMLAAGARQPGDQQAAGLEPGPRPARLRLLQPLDPRPEGGRLRELPRPGRPDAPDVEGRADDDGVVPEVPPQPGASPPAERKEIFNMDWSRRGERAARAAGANW